MLNITPGNSSVLLYAVGALTADFLIQSKPSWDFLSCDSPLQNNP